MRKTTKHIHILSTCALAALLALGTFSTSTFAADKKSVVGKSASSKSEAMTLDQALREAYVGNPGFSAEKARLRVTDELLPQARSTALPQVYMTSQYGNDRTKNNIGTKSDENQYAYAVTLSQPLFRGFRTYHAMESAEAKIKAGREAFADSEQTLFLNTVQAYASVIRDRNILALQQQNVGILNNIVDQSQTGFKGGELTRTDISQSQSRLYAGQNELRKAQVNLIESENYFRRIVGKTPPKLTEPHIPDNLLPKDARQVVDIAGQNNPRLKQAQFLRDASEADKKAAYGEFLPTVNVEATSQKQHNYQKLFSTETEHSVFLKVSAPIFRGGIEYSKTREARAYENQKEMEALDARRLVASASQNSFEQYKAAIDRLNLSNKQVNAAGAAASGTSLEFKINRRRLVDVLDAQNEVVLSKIAREQAKFDRLVTGYALLANLGKLSIVNLQTEPKLKEIAVQEVYKPEDNYNNVKWGIPRFSNGID